MRDLFGQEIPDAPAPSRRLRQLRDFAHPAKPGTGPAGQTCRTCANRCRVEGGTKIYQKCGLLKAAWTKGPATDLHCRDAACSFFRIDTPERAPSPPP